MTLDLEDKLRAAMAAKAETVTVSPDAWQKTHVRPVARRAVRRWAAPLAVAAAMAAAASTALVVGGGHTTTPPDAASLTQHPHGVVPSGRQGHPRPARRQPPARRDHQR